MITDYSNEKNWAVKRNIGANSKFDLIYIYGTVVMTSERLNGTSEICREMKIAGIKSFLKTGSELGLVRDSNNKIYTANVYVPLYQQLALDFELANMDKHTDLFGLLRNSEAIEDLRAFFDYYFEYCNKDGKRPFVISGYSQGAAALQVMLEDYFLKEHKSYFKNCIAYYCFGYGVSKKWFNSLDTDLGDGIKFTLASGPYDTHCLISWNIEGPEPYTKSPLLADEEYDTYVINPLNWKTDDTYAPKSLNTGSLVQNLHREKDNVLSPAYIVSKKEEDLFDAKIDLKRGSIISNKPENCLYVDIPPFTNIWGGKSLHFYEGAAYYTNVGHNLGDRIDVWFKNN